MNGNNLQKCHTFDGALCVPGGGVSAHYCYSSSSHGWFLFFWTQFKCQPVRESLPDPSLPGICPITLFNTLLKHSNCYLFPLFNCWVLEGTDACSLWCLIYSSVPHTPRIGPDTQRVHNKCVSNEWMSKRFSKTPAPGSAQPSCCPAEPNITPEPAACHEL